ncbi:hypothetical protein EVJ58_g9118 [Rhodofomes roseus]|uniref:Uncharacterized protein n=1 Tax=Rhodofomes roseus TaxID=34475 RepID=A0A4Y9XX88_9APHY|nr:hypothetical protein EVJ58_g9118 [Rhodofomes roseus]
MPGRPRARLVLSHENCRWGQAVAVLDDVLFVQGGGTDQYNQYAYPSAPPVNDMLALPLTSSFSLSSVPWDYVSGCSNCSSSQGPAVAWHTLSPLNTSSLLVFGGYLGPNSLISLPEQPDSAALVNIASITKRVWSTGTIASISQGKRRPWISSHPVLWPPLTYSIEASLATLRLIAAAQDPSLIGSSSSNASHPRKLMSVLVSFFVHYINLMPGRPCFATITVVSSPVALT